MFEKIKEKANSMGYELLKVESFPHKDDEFLKAVIARNSFEHVSWIYNVNDNSFYSGYYTQSFESADAKLQDRIKNSYY